mmetsp:Transcript_36301/g.104473  ORF Transcript_36301/g.104473 Transcript_36301/m.104473 type:complete len:952 (+) Transcript_36301:75-2930(+)
MPERPPPAHTFEEVESAQADCESAHQVSVEMASPGPSTPRTTVEGAPPLPGAPPPMRLPDGPRTGRPRPSSGSSQAKSPLPEAGSPDEASIMRGSSADESVDHDAVVTDVINNLNYGTEEFDVDRHVKNHLAKIGLDRETMQAHHQLAIEVKKQAQALEKLRSAMEEAEKSLITEARLQAVLQEHRADLVTQDRFAAAIEQQSRAMTPDVLKEVMHEQHRTLLVNEQSLKETLAKMEGELIQERVQAWMAEHEGGTVTEERLKAVLAEHRVASREREPSATDDSRQVPQISDEQLAAAMKQHRSDLICEKALRVALEEKTATLVSEERVQELIQAATGSPPKTASTRPCTMETAVLTSAQMKADWSAPNMGTVQVAPNHDENGRLTHGNLETSMFQRAMAIVPNHHGLNDALVHDVVSCVVHDVVNHFEAGMPHVVHDIVSCVVRDIVGTFEGLLDRLLLEKKHGTVRNMVAELMTEDISKTIATGQEQLKNKELGHLNREIARLQTELADMEARWDQRYGVHDERHEQQAKTAVAADDRHRELDARVAVTEKDYVRRTQLDERMKAVTEEFHDLRTYIQKNRASIDKALQEVAEFEEYAKSNFALRSFVEEVRTESGKAVGDLREHTDRGLDGLRERCATVVQVTELKAEHDRRLNALREELDEAKSGLSKLSAEFVQEQHDTRATYATKVELQTASKTLATQQEELERSLRKSFDELDAKAAEKVVVEQLAADTKRSTEEINSKLSAHDASLIDVSGHVSKIQDLCDATLATREYALGVAVEQARKAANEADDTQEIAQLRREFEEERERLRLQVRQQQTTRKDLNDAQELLHGVKRMAADSLKQCTDMEDMVKGTVDKEVEARKKERVEMVELRQRHTTLEEVVKNLRQELSSHVVYQQAKDDKLRDHSTQRYLEQIDRALALSKSVGTLEQEHRDLKDTVVKLPKVG